MLIRRLLAIVSAFALVLTAVPTATLAQAEPEGVPLSLDECLRTALKNNLSLVSASYTPQMREQDVVSNAAGFDPTVEANLGRTKSKSTPIQASNPAESQTTWLTFGMRQNQAKFGGSYFAGVELGQQEQLGQDVNFADFYRSTLVFDVNFPLLKNFGTEVNTVNLRLARNDRDVSYRELERQAQLTMQEVEGAYWDVLAAWAALNVAKQSLQRAQDLLDLNRKKVEVGTLAPIEITQAEAGVAEVEEDVIIAEVGLYDAQDELRRLLAIPKHDPLWADMINPTDRPSFERTDVDVDAAIETALVERPEMYAAETTLRSREMSERVAKRQIRHQLDLVGNYRPQGSSPDINDFFLPGQIPDSSIGTAWDRIGNEYNWTAQLVYRIPIANRAAKSNYAKASISRSQAETDLSNQEQTIRVEVRIAARAVESGIKRVDAAATNVRLQREKLEAEQKKFENGMSTSFEVLTFQNDLSSAELRHIQAQLDYVKALAALERAKGTLLQARGLDLKRDDDKKEVK